MKMKIAIILVCSVFVSFAFSNWGLTESSEARYAQISNEMLQTKDWLHPTLMGIHHYHKPPLTYYITAAGLSIFGTNEYGVRFFLQISLLLQVLLVYLVAKKTGKSDSVSFAAALLYFSYPIAHIASINLTTDSYLTTFIFAAIFFFLHYQQKLNWLWLFLFWLVNALAFLTKGPVGILPQFIFALCWHWQSKKNIRLGVAGLISFLIFLVLSFSWFLLLMQEHPGIINYFLGHQIVDRVAGDAFKRTQPFWYYLLLMPLIALPGVILFVKSFFKQGVVDTYSPPRVNNKILWVPFILMLIIFSASSSKLMLYVLPLYLFVAILSADALFTISPLKLQVYERFILYFSVVVFAALALASVFPVGKIVMPKLYVIIMAAISVAIMFCISRLKKNFLKQWAAPVYAATFMALLMFCLPPVMKQNEFQINSTKPLAAYLQKHTNIGDTLVVYDQLLPSLAFYINRPMHTLHKQNHNTAREFIYQENVPLNRFLFTDLNKSNYNVGRNKMIISSQKLMPPAEIISNRAQISFSNKFTIYR